MYVISRHRFPTASYLNLDSRFGLTLVAGNEVMEVGSKLRHFNLSHKDIINNPT
jgi:hypothetical protein